MPLQTDDVRVPDVEREETPTVTAHESCTDRMVFTERGNKEGWIATDLTIDSWR